MDYYGKTYSVDDIDAKSYYDIYFTSSVSDDIFQESTINPMQAFYKAFSTGLVSGNTLIDCRQGPVIGHLLATKDFVKEITLLEMNAHGLKAVKNWLTQDSDAFDFSRAKEVLKQLKRKDNRSYGYESVDEEGDLRGKIANTLIFPRDTPGDLLLPKADIATSMWFLETASKDHEDFKRILKKIFKLIKLGGFFLLYASINASYFKVGEDKFPLLTCDEGFYRKAISERGFEIKHFERYDRVMSPDIINHETVGFYIAQKIKE